MQERQLERKTERQTERKKARMQEIKQEMKKDRKEERERKEGGKNGKEDQERKGTCSGLRRARKDVAASVAHTGCMEIRFFQLSEIFFISIFEDYF